MQGKHKLHLENYKSLPSQQRAIADCCRRSCGPSKQFNDFYISVGEAAAARARALCEQYGFSEESVREVEPITDDLHNVNKFEFHAVTEQDIEKIAKHDSIEQSAMA